MPLEAILHEAEQLHDRQRASCDIGGATFACVRAAKRKFRIVKRENNIPVLGVCEYCHAEFSADPETIGRPRDAHAHIQKQFIAHKCKQFDASKNAVRIVSEGCRIALMHIGTPSTNVEVRRLRSLTWL
jgi:hypothetical protein